MTAKSLYMAGDSVEGEVQIKSEDEFQHNAIHLTFTGREHTRIVVSHGKTSTTYTEERVYFSQRLDIAGEGTMTTEGIYFPFNFAIPEEVPSSYKGSNGWIDYTLKAVIERSWAIDPKSEVEVAVRNIEKMPLSQAQQGFIDDDGYPVLIVEVDKDAVTLGGSLNLRFRVEQEMKMRGVRIELIAEEEAHAKRYHRTSKTKLIRESVNIDEIQRGLWMDVRLGTDEMMPYTFNREILSNRIFIKVTLDIPWARDKSIMLPLRLGFYSSASETEPSKIFDFEWGS
jgi:hypothetical protein